MKTNIKMQSCLIYLRVSTEEQAKEGFSLDNQRKSCSDYAQICGYSIERVFVDDGKSGTNTEGRPAFKQMMALLKEKPTNAVIILKIDRIARNVGDFSNMRKEFKRMSIKLLSVQENGDVTEGLIGNIFASVAEWESQVNGQRTKDALMQKFREGWQPTPPPLGYISVGGDRERKTCEPDTYVAPIIKELFELYATGNYSILEIQDWLADKNLLSKSGTTICHSVINTILSNPFYYGMIRWRGETKAGNQRPIISKELFETCQYVLAKHRNFMLRRRTHDFLLRGFITCAECGLRYTAEWHKDAKKFKNRGGRIGYYHCIKRNRNGCPAPYVEISDMESQIASEFKNIQFNQEFIDAVVRKTKERLMLNRKEHSSRKQSITNQKTALELKRNRLEDNLLDGTLDRDTYKRKHTEIESKINNLTSDIQTIESQSKIDMDLIEEVLAFTRDIYKTYIEAPPFMKRHYLRFFYEEILVKDKQIHDVVYTPIFASLQANREVIISKHWLPRVDSNHEPYS